MCRASPVPLSETCCRRMNVIIAQKNPAHVPAGVRDF